MSDDRSSQTLPRDVMERALRPLTNSCRCSRGQRPGLEVLCESGCADGWIAVDHLIAALHEAGYEIRLTPDPSL